LEDTGRLVIAVGQRALLVERGRLTAGADLPELPTSEPVPEGAQRDPYVISSWIERHPDEARVLYAEHAWSLPLCARPAGRFSVLTDARSARSNAQRMNPT
jgi:hypothetical protein